MSQTTSDPKALLNKAIGKFLNDKIKNKSDTKN